MWKHRVWKKGTVEVTPVLDTIILGNMSKLWLQNCQKLLEGNKQLQDENTILTKNREEMIKKLEEIEKVKKKLEDSLYAQFLLLLNSKKRKIRELEEKLKQEEISHSQSAYNVSTDESDDEQGGSEQEENRETLPGTKKRKLDEEASPSLGFIRRSNSPNSSLESNEDLVLKYEETQETGVTELNLFDESPEDDPFLY